MDQIDQDLMGSQVLPPNITVGGPDAPPMPVVISPTVDSKQHFLIDDSKSSSVTSSSGIHSKTQDNRMNIEELVQTNDVTDGPKTGGRYSKHQTERLDRRDNSSKATGGGSSTKIPNINVTLNDVQKGRSRRQSIEEKKTNIENDDELGQIVIIDPAEKPNTDRDLSQRVGKTDKDGNQIDALNVPTMMSSFKKAKLKSRQPSKDSQQSDVLSPVNKGRVGQVGNASAHSDFSFANEVNNRDLKDGQLRMS